MKDQETESPRRRTPPAERFAGTQHVFDLSAAIAELRREPNAAHRGHRQKTLLQRAPVTQALFAFEPNGELADHAANGLVTIHVLEGRLRVQATGQTHELKAGMMVVLDPHVRHSVRADTTAAMLLTVYLETGQA